MQFVAGSHHQQILPHRDTFDTTNLLSRGQELAIDVADEDAVDVVLSPGAGLVSSRSNVSCLGSELQRS